MKKTFLTAIAIMLGFTTVFAQATGTEQGQQQEQADEVIIGDREAVQQEGEEGEGTRIEMQDLPQEVQDAFRNSEYSEWEVLGVFELPPEEAAVEVGEQEGKVYAFELMETDPGTAAQGQEEDGTEGGAVVRQPDVVVHFDEEGEQLKAKDPQEVREEVID